MDRQAKNSSTATVTAKLNSWFTEYGYPEYIPTYGGPQFRKDFKTYCDKHYIHQELSSLYNPESNGLAEAAVKKRRVSSYAVLTERRILA